MKCANCENSAAFTVTNPATLPINYCTYCLPVHLRARASLGHFPLSILEEEPTPVKKSRKKPQ